MGFRAKNEIIYSRVYGKTKREFERQMADSGYKNSSDFMEYLLRVNKGKQVDGVTLKEFTDVMKEVAHELKKQGVNINQIARAINIMAKGGRYHESFPEILYEIMSISNRLDVILDVALEEDEK